MLPQKIREQLTRLDKVRLEALSEDPPDVEVAVAAIEAKVRLLEEHGLLKRPVLRRSKKRSCASKSISRLPRLSLSTGGSAGVGTRDSEGGRAHPWRLQHLPPAPTAPSGRSATATGERTACDAFASG
jgi:hypothetical protein